MSEGKDDADENDEINLTREGKKFVGYLMEKLKTTLKVEDLDEETTRMTERTVVLRISTKHINLWMRQLEMKRMEICELAGLIGLEEVKKEIGNEKSLEAWARRCTNHFTRKVKRLLYAETDNMIWNESESEIAKWCRRNKISDEITDDEMMEICRREDRDDDEPVRLNGKYVWETAKRVCDFINAHEDLIAITTFGEYRALDEQGDEGHQRSPQY